MVRAQMKPTKTRDPSVAVCRAALELLMLCVHHKPTRLIMKKVGVVCVLFCALLFLVCCAVLTRFVWCGVV